MPPPQTLLSKLTERERTVLRMVCDHTIYRDIGAKLYLSEEAIKLEMGRVYIKLGLDHLSREQRRQKLTEVYCPVLKGAELPPPPAEPEQPEEVPGAVTDMVNDDERALVVWQQPGQIVAAAPVVDVKPIPVRAKPVRTRRRAGCVLLFVGMLAGAGIMIGTFLVLRGSGNGTTPPPLPTAPAIAQVTLVSQPITVVVTATPPPATSTDAASPSPSPVPPSATPVPSPTPEANTPPGSLLKVGDTWKQDGLFVTLQTADLSTFQGTGEIWLSFNVANHTGSDLALSLDQRNVILETNTGVRFKPFYSEGDTSVWQQTVENGDREDVRFHYSTRYSWLGDYFAPGVNYVRVIVRDWSRMNEGIWQIDINH